MNKDVHTHWYSSSCNNPLFAWNRFQRGFFPDCYNLNPTSNPGSTINFPIHSYNLYLLPFMFMQPPHSLTLYFESPMDVVLSKQLVKKIFSLNLSFLHFIFKAKGSYLAAPVSSPSNTRQVILCDIVDEKELLTWLQCYFTTVKFQMNPWKAKSILGNSTFHFYWKNHLISCFNLDVFQIC